MFYRFEGYFKEISKMEAKLIEFPIFRKELDRGEQVLHQKETFEQRLSLGHPVIHATHIEYTSKFAEDIKTCQRLVSILEIVTNRRIKERHWKRHNL